MFRITALVLTSLLFVSCTSFRTVRYRSVEVLPQWVLIKEGRVAKHSDGNAYVMAVGSYVADHADEDGRIANTDVCETMAVNNARKELAAFVLSKLQATDKSVKELYENKETRTELVATIEQNLSGSITLGRFHEVVDYNPENTKPYTRLECGAWVGIAKTSVITMLSATLSKHFPDSSAEMSKALAKDLFAAVKDID